MPLMNTYTYVLFSWLLSLLHNFIQWNLNSGSGQVQIMLMASWRFAMVRIWQRSQLEIRLNAFCQSTIPQKQFIIIIIIPFLMTDKNLKTSLFWVMRKKEAFACTILGKICYVVGTIIRIGKLICLCAILLERHCMSLNDNLLFFNTRQFLLLKILNSVCVLNLCLNIWWHHQLYYQSVSAMNSAMTVSREKWGRGKYKNLNILGNEKSFLWNKEHI